MKGKTTSGRHDSSDIEPRPENPGGQQDRGETRVRRGRTDTADAFLPDPDDGPMRATDELAETLGEDVVRAATTGQDADNEALDQVVPEELGGPFVETTADQEFALGPDESNPEDALAEPLPRAVHGLAARPREE